MKFLLSSFIVLLVAGPLGAQQLQFNTSDPLLHGSHYDIHSSPGISGDNYYILYNNYDHKRKGKDLAHSYLKIYSVEKGTLLRSVDLNAIVSDSQEDRHTLFTDVFLWKGHLLGLYASWKPNGTLLNLYGQLLDEHGDKVGSPVLVETLASAGKQDKKADRTVQMDAKNIAELPGDLHYSFDSDSASVALYYTGETWHGFQPALIKPNLQQIKKWKADFGTDSQLLQCVPDEKGNLYALVKLLPETDGASPSYRLLGFSPLGSVPSSRPLALPGKVIQDAGFRFDTQGNILVTGTYALVNNSSRANSTYGVFAMKMNIGGNVLHSDIKPFADGMVSDLAGYKASAKRKGLGKVIKINRIIPLPGSGLASVGQSFTQSSEVTAYPVILTPHYDASGEIILTRIDPTGEVKWISYLKRYYEDYPATTAPVPFYATQDKNSHLLVIYDENGEQKTRQQIFVDRYGDKGISDRDWMPLPRNFNTRSTWILWNTACRINDNAIMVAYYNTWKKRMGTLKIGLQREVRVTANP